VLGLIISLVVLWYAKKASEAARAAKEVVLKRNVADDLEEARRIAQELPAFLRMNKWEVAQLKADELRMQASWLIARWEDRLDTVSRSRLMTARELLRSMVEDLNKMVQNSISEKQKADVLSDAESVREIFIEEHGKFLAKVD
jgi:hypothetical protein